MKRKGDPEDTGASLKGTSGSGEKNGRSSKTNRDGEKKKQKIRDGGGGGQDRRSGEPRIRQLHRFVRG